MIRSSLQLLAVLGLVFCALSQAQQADPQETLADRLKNLSQQLNLTDAQKEKIRPILVEEVKQLKALRDDEAISHRDKFDKYREIRDNGLQQIRPLLTEDQQKKLDQIRRQMKQQAVGQVPQKRNDTQSQD